MRKVRVAPKGMGIHEFVAQEEGFFAEEGIQVEFDWKTFKGTQSSWKGYKYLERPQDKPYTEAKDGSLIQCACVWGSISNASAGMGRFVPDCYGVSPWAIFVRPESNIRRPEELKDVPVSVGLRAGSHFNVPFRLEKYMALENIKTVNTGGFGARLKALLDKEVEAASLLPPQIDMAKQLGLRAIIEDEFHTLWWVPESGALDADLGKYLHLWKISIPAELEHLHAWDFSRFSRGERFVYKPMPRSEFDEVLEQVERWGLDDHLKERSFEKLTYRV